MQFSNSFKSSLASLVAFIVILSFCTSQPVFAAGPVISWGSRAVSSSDFDCNDFVAIAAGWEYSLALKQDGSIVGWGWNASGQATPPAGNDFVAIAAGRNYSLAIREPCQYVLAGDVNDDCKVNFYDFAKMAENWLINCHLDPNDPECTPK